MDLAAVDHILTPTRSVRRRLDFRRRVDPAVLRECLEIAVQAPTGGNLARYINHKCAPNCYTRVIGDTIWIVAAKNIRKGEELSYDYSTDGEGSIQCRCRPGCKTIF